MSKPSVNSPCPCGSGAKLKKCCGLWHKTGRAPTPQALMRSRYTAYALGLVDYVLQTTHPEGPPTDRPGVQRFCEITSFDGLRIEHHVEDGTHGEVRFHATLTQLGKDVSFTEHSVFEKVDGRWLYKGRLA